ncbi:hypothetical protein SDC9_158839 [bioreactor metagenome]|uniref:PPM-type phosphatase domain-containing protein n=1 Tax=bioreactor metagenome TaxID=1076179 RepID=A0A645FD13_9ZZZZ
MEATKQVGGDFFDFFLIDSNKLGFVICDVSGKGVPSSIFMAVARTLIHSFGIAGYSTAECLKLTNKILCDHSVDSMFVTVFYGILDITTGEVTYTNAGHNYPFIVSGLGVIQALTQGSSIILGIFEDAEFILNTIKLEPNTSILLYTDGVTESMDEFNNQLGEEALSRHIKKLTTIGFDRPNPKFIVNSVFDLVKQHARNSSKQSDDITVLCITYYG